MRICKDDTVESVLERIRKQIDAAQYDAEDLDIECVFTAEEVKDFLLELEEAFKKKRKTYVQGELFEDIPS